MSNSRRKSFYDWAADYPPILVRMLARGNDGRPLSHDQIAVGARLSVLEVMFISERLDWRLIDIPTAKAFTATCGVDFTERLAMNRQECYLRGKTINGRRQPPRFKYLVMAPDYQSYFRPLYERWMESLR